MKEQFIEGSQPGNPQRKVQRIGFIFTEKGADGGICRDICECDPLPKNFSVITRFFESWKGLEIEAYVTDQDGSYNERHVLISAIPEGCRLPRLCVLRDGKSQDVKRWFLEKCSELHPKESVSK